MSKFCVPCAGSGSITSINFGRISCFKCRTCNGSGKEPEVKLHTLSAEIELHDKPRYIAHTGKGRPVARNAVVSVIFHDSPECVGPMAASYWADGDENWWIHDDTENSDCHIIAYRVIEQE
jgi:hypothetical protein